MYSGGIVWQVVPQNVGELLYSQAYTPPVNNSTASTTRTAYGKISIQVGKPGHSKHQIDTVSFTVPNTHPGDGTPIKGSDEIVINLEIRTTASRPLTAFLTVDSATPLNNGQGSTIPTSKISWIASDGDIPSGTFAGTSNQLLVSYSGYVSVNDRHTFYYANDAVYDAGTYSGQVTYTWFVP